MLTLPIISGQTFTLVMLRAIDDDGKPLVRKGKWQFTSDGGGCMYPRLVNTTTGDVIPWEAVAIAYKDREVLP